MKINYKGQELETITEGYWPEGKTLVMICENAKNMPFFRNVFCLHKGVAYSSALTATLSENYHWAILPPKPAPRRLTNREVGELCKKGYDVIFAGDIYYGHYPLKVDPRAEDAPANVNASRLRATGSDEWLEPTTDLLEGAE